MGRLIQMVTAKKQKIINTLISEKVYPPSDRPLLFDMPLKSLEELLREGESGIPLKNE